MAQVSQVAYDGLVAYRARIAYDVTQYATNVADYTQYAADAEVIRARCAAELAGLDAIIADTTVAP